jgi:hypothetical protein
MPENNTNNSLGNFSDLDDEILIKQDDGFKIFSHGTFSDFKQKNFEVPVTTTDIIDTGMEEKVLAPLHPQVWKKDSSFYFDIDDEDEIKENKIKIEKQLKIESKRYSLKKVCEKLMEGNNIRIVPDLEKRFAGLVFSFLKHTREKLDVLAILKQSINKSGIGLDEATSSKLMALLLEMRAKIDESRGQIIKDVEEELVVEKKLNNDKPLSNLDPMQELKIETNNSTIPFVARSPLSNKPKIEDVKSKRNVVSPIEELGEINLTLFRRLSPSPLEATQKIIDKIYSFERESYAKKSLAVSYWRKSEVYKLYMSLGVESMEKSISIEKLIEQKIIANEKTLNQEEFKAILDMNKKIRF